MRAGACAVLRYMLTLEDDALFGEEVVARLRGMLADVARQLAEAAGAIDADTLQRLNEEITRCPTLIGHVHALALEWQATTRLEARLGVPLVLSPLLQALIASEDAATADAAMRFLAAQARFARNQTRMALPLGELPPEVLHAVLGIVAGQEDGVRASTPEPPDQKPASQAIAALYDEATTRLALAGRLVVAMGGGAVAALAPDHAGYALFASALSRACAEPREACILALQQGHGVRGGVMLRAAWRPLAEITAALLVLHPDAPPCDLSDTSPEAAMALLGGAEPL